MEKSYDCPVVEFSELIRGKYKLRIIWQLKKEKYRFGELQRAVCRASNDEAVTPRVLSRELKDLVGKGLIRRKQYNGLPMKVEYSITPFGRTLIPILEAIVEWDQQTKRFNRNVSS